MWSLYYNFWRDIPWPAAATLIPACCAGAVASATSLCFAAMAVYNSEEVVFKSDEDDSSPVSDEEDETSDCTLAEDSPDDDELQATAQKSSDWLHQYLLLPSESILKVFPRKQNC